MRVLLFGTYDASLHPRIATIAEGLRAHGLEVSECNAPLGLPTAARVQMLARPWRVPALLARIARRWTTLARAARRLPAPDVVLVGYLGHFDVHLARLLFRRAPVVLDHLIGASDTARDRRLGGTVRQALLTMIDAAALRAADVIVVDTQEHLSRLPGAHRARAVVVPVGAPTAWHQAARLAGDRPADGPLRVVFYGLYTPLQGTPVIGAALSRIAGIPGTPVQVTMIGGGQDKAAAMAAAGPAGDVRWLDWVTAADLPELVAGHHVCLGIFGTGDKARRVVPNKVFQGAAAGCAIVTSDTAPQRRALGEAALLVPPGDPGALAAELLRLAGDRGELDRLRGRARELAAARFVPRQIVTPLVRVLGPAAGPERKKAAAGPAPKRVVAGTADMDALAPLTPNAWLRYELVKRMLPADVKDVLEVGCGQGALGARLARRYRYVGVEPDQASWAVARDRISAAGQGEVRNVAVRDLGDSVFDLVCAFEVLEHIEDDAGALREWAARLRPDGWLLLSVPAHQRRFGPADEIVGHFRRYDPGAMTALLTSSGFTQIQLRQYGFPLGYLLEAGRNLVGRRRLATAGGMSAAERTAGSGRLLQPSGVLRGTAARWGTAPFRVLQRPFPGTGTGLVVLARSGAPESVEGPAG